MTRRLLVLALAWLPAACADGCDCGGSAAPVVPAATVDDAGFDAAGGEVGVAPTTPPTAPAAGSDSDADPTEAEEVGSDDTAEAQQAEGATDDASGEVIPPPARFVRPNIEIRTLQPGRPTNAVAPRVVAPRLREPLSTPTSTADE